VAGGRSPAGGGRLWGVGRVQGTVEPLQALHTPDAAHVCGRDSQPLRSRRWASVACARADRSASWAWVLRLPEAHAIGRARWITGGNAGLESPAVTRVGPSEVPRAPLCAHQGTGGSLGGGGGSGPEARRTRSRTSVRHPLRARSYGMVWYGMVPLLPPGPQSLRPCGQPLRNNHYYR
jgi:hypothetical protein